MVKKKDDEQEKFTVEAIRREVHEINLRMNGIEFILEEAGIPQNKKRELRNEKKGLNKRLLALRTNCPHTELDRSTGGGLFCSICDTYLGILD